MTEWLSLTDAQRRTSLEQTQIRSGIIPKAIEKDWWVTLVLKVLFELPIAQYCIFKGGTSLSKGWHLINRLSEDIDVALSLEAFGMEYKQAPSHTYVKDVKRKGCLFVTQTIKELLEKRLGEYDLHGKTIEVYAGAINPILPDKDPQEIFVKYISLYEPDEYLEDRVKIEFSTRSIKDPFEIVKVQSILSEYFQQLPYQEISFEVPVASPHKTFVEKMCLMHEKISIKEILKPDVERQSRHLYDLVQMAEKGVLDQVMEDVLLYNIIIDHRKNWIRLKDIDYNTLQPKIIAFVPAEDLMEAFRKDYDKMLEGMIYGDPPNFNEMITKLKNINMLINKI
ncbi:MAG TPA: nucleotidyl transferase AbiEii/AbiGii toxin family protein [Arachidicoccus soli]|nr:nucleotidyl transferase AbiEii/AbiGii toxin family protein [Arachidicoccus soli]